MADAKVVQKEQTSQDGHPFRIWWECSACGCQRVLPRDIYCRDCGVRFQ